MALAALIVAMAAAGFGDGAGGAGDGGGAGPGGAGPGGAGPASHRQCEPLHFRVSCPFPSQHFFEVSSRGTQPCAVQAVAVFSSCAPKGAAEAASTATAAKRAQVLSMMLGMDLEKKEERKKKKREEL